MLPRLHSSSNPNSSFLFTSPFCSSHSLFLSHFLSFGPLKFEQILFSLHILYLKINSSPQSLLGSSVAVFNCDSITVYYINSNINNTDIVHALSHVETQRLNAAEYGSDLSSYLLIFFIFRYQLESIYILCSIVGCSDHPVPKYLLYLSLHTEICLYRTKKKKKKCLCRVWLCEIYN